MKRIEELLSTASPQELSRAKRLFAKQPVPERKIHR